MKFSVALFALLLSFSLAFGQKATYQPVVKTSNATVKKGATMAYTSNQSRGTTKKRSNGTRSSGTRTNETRRR